MFVRSDEWNIAELVFKVNTKGFDTVTHGVCRRNPWKVLEEVRDHSFVNWLIEAIIVVI
jgi:hypothetical protein